MTFDWEGYAKMLEATIEAHRQKVMSLGLHEDARGDLVWGGQYDRELWAALGLPDRPTQTGSEEA